jgi:hypothetical protein
MVLGRRVIHDARLYEPLAEALGDVVAARPGIRHAIRILAAVRGFTEECSRADYRT